MSCFRFVRVSLTYRVMGSVSSFGGWGGGLGGGAGWREGASSMPRARICLVVQRVWSSSYKSRAGNCVVVSRLGVGRSGARLSNTHRARVCQDFRRLRRLCFKRYTGIYLIGLGDCFKPYTGIYLIVRWVDSLC